MAREPLGVRRADMSSDHYRTLGVGRRASQAEVREAYLELARRLHPDRNPASPSDFRAVQTAWEVLRDPASHKAYDAHKGMARRYDADYDESPSRRSPEERAAASMNDDDCVCREE